MGGTHDDNATMRNVAPMQCGTHAGNTIWCSLIDGSDRTRFVFCRFIRYCVD